MDDIRNLRNKFLSLTDKCTVPDFPITTEQKQELFAYRQSLRDLPQNLPELLDNREANILNYFPEKPSFVNLCPFS